MSNTNTYLFYRACDFLKWHVDNEAYRVYLPVECFEDEECLSKISSLDCEVFAVLPRIRRDDISDLADNLKVDGFLAENIADLILLKGKRFACDTSFNATNTHTIEFLRDAGAVSVTLSPESTVLPEVYGIRYEYVADGPIPVMLCEHCPVSTAVGKEEGEKCGECLKRKDKTFYLENEKGGRFPVICNPKHCRAIILSKENFTHPGRLPADALRRINIFYGD